MLMPAHRRSDGVVRSYRGRQPSSPPVMPVAEPARVRLIAALSRQERVPCTVDTDSHYPSSSAAAEHAAQLCQSCPVQPECLAFALTNEEEHGVWGGHVFGAEDAEDQAAGDGRTELQPAAEVPGFSRAMEPATVLRGAVPPPSLPKIPAFAGERREVA